MGSTDLRAASVAEVLSCLGVPHATRYRREFSEVLRNDRDLATDDWSAEPELLEVFYCYLRHSRPSIVVEIGTYKGTAAIVFHAAVLKNGTGRVVTIDNNKAGTLRAARKRFKAREIGSGITLLEKSSNRAFVKWKREPIDFLFIDGSHNYRHSCCDFALWARMVTKQGMIAIHDTGVDPIFETTG